MFQVTCEIEYRFRSTLKKTSAGQNYSVAHYSMPLLSDRGTGTFSPWAVPDASLITLNSYARPQHRAAMTDRWLLNLFPDHAANISIASEVYLHCREWAITETWIWTRPAKPPRLEVLLLWPRLLINYKQQAGYSSSSHNNGKLWDHRNTVIRDCVLRDFKSSRLYFTKKKLWRT